MDTNRIRRPNPKLRLRVTIGKVTVRDCFSCKTAAPRKAAEVNILLKLLCRIASIVEDQVIFCGDRARPKYGGSSEVLFHY